MQQLLKKVTNPLLIFTFISTILLKSCRCLQLPCETGDFFDIDTSSCITCSSCKDGEITRKTCSDFSDTVCGPFYEFFDILKSKENASKPSSGDVHADLKEDTWYIVTLVMIGCLCISTVIMFALAIVLALMCRKRRKERQLWTSEEETIEDTEKILTVHVSSDT